MLKVKLFRAFALVVVLFGVLSGFLGTRIINQRIVEEAQTRVSLDLSSAWSIFDSKRQELAIITRLVANKEAVVDMCQSADWTNSEVQSRLERIRVGFGLDFLDVIGPDGKVMTRTAPPHTSGDYRISDPAVTSALRGEPLACITLLSRGELEKEADGLAERAFLPMEATPHSRRSEKKEESRGMVMVSAVPVRAGPNVLAVIYGGILINRNLALVDHISEVVFKTEQYNGLPVGTATIFLDDARIATTVRMKNNNRALGTRASKEVADRVLDNGLPWVGPAIVVDNPCLTAYEPIRDGNDRVIGMLYVGILKKPFDEIARSVMLRYLFVSLFVLLVALALAFIVAGRLAQPIHQLAGASRKMSNGQRPDPVPTNGSCRETELLIAAFNEMARSLAEREERLKVLNRSYMETLGFVSHELKGPVATVMNYVYLLREEKLGALTEKQARAIRTIDSCGARLVEMVRHYLNLSRIENGEIQPVRSRVAVMDDILKPLLDAAEMDIHDRHMTVVMNVAPDTALLADLNMAREVFENLIHNAVKYGRDGATVTITATPSDNDFVAFTVRNEGEGIPPDKIGDLFQKFSRLHSEKKQKGTGLGLFITKYIVEAHGGRITAASRAGEWVEFTFTLPCYRATPGGASAEGRAHP